MFPNFLVVRSGRFFVADSAVDMTRALCAPALAAANWLVTNHLVHTAPLTLLLSAIRYLQSLPLDPFAPYSADARPFYVFCCDFSIAIGQITASVCASENLDKLLGTLIRRNMIPRCESYEPSACVATRYTISYLLPLYLPHRILPAQRPWQPRCAATCQVFPQKRHVGYQGHAQPLHRAAKSETP
jgi:hypothetical protein